MKVYGLGVRFMKVSLLPASICLIQFHQHLCRFAFAQCIVCLGVVFRPVNHTIQFLLISNERSHHKPQLLCSQVNLLLWGEIVHRIAT